MGYIANPEHELTFGALNLPSPYTWPSWARFEVSQNRNTNTPGESAAGGVGHLEG